MPATFDQSHESNTQDRVRTCSIDPDRIHELGHEPSDATPPHEDGDAPSSNMEREKLDQKSCPFRQEDIHDGTDALSSLYVRALNAILYAGLYKKMRLQNTR